MYINYKSNVLKDSMIEAKTRPFETMAWYPSPKLSPTHLLYWKKWS